MDLRISFGEGFVTYPSRPGGRAPAFAPEVVTALLRG